MCRKLFAVSRFESYTEMNRAQTRPANKLERGGEEGAAGEKWFDFCFFNLSLSPIYDTTEAFQATLLPINSIEK